MSRKKNATLRHTRDLSRRKKPTEGKAWTEKFLRGLKELEEPCEPSSSKTSE